MRTLVAIPVFNEARYVAGVLEKVRAYVDDVLVVDDGSTDGTGKILNETGGISIIRHGGNQGYGQSLIDAFGFARGQGYEWIITMDCDDQHEPEAIPEFIERARQCDVDIISGSRYLEEMPGDTSAPEDRLRINRTITKMLNEELGLKLTDAFCGFKAHRVAAMARMGLSEAGYAFPLQFWAQAARLGLGICEMPVRLIYNDPTRHFGGQLDDPEARLAHYREVFREEMEAGKRMGKSK